MATIAPIQALLTTATCGTASLAATAPEAAGQGGMFLQESLQRLYPDVAYQQIVSLPPPRHLSGGKGRFDLFQVDVTFESGLERSLLIFVSRAPLLDGLYESIAAADPGREVSHRFGVRGRALAEPGGTDYHLFSVDFHEGFSVFAVTDLLERLVGVPGLESEGRAPTESDRKRLAGWGLIPEGEEVDADRLRELLFRVDRGAVEATFRFYKTTGYFPRDPRRHNVILNVVEGRWVFRVIDYEHMSPFTSPRDVLMQYYQVFETEAPDGCFVERGIRPWSWGFLDDKTGFFEGVLGGLGEEEGIEFLQAALAEYASLPNPSGYEMEIMIHLSRFLIQRGVVFISPESTLQKSNHGS
ncbi:MAG TPA: hypothetical protein VFX30_11435 [bacterium]|nr:hypothetical protein [bacterium]